MDRTSAAALKHLQTMETRINQQTALITELRQSGEDTLEAAQRLVLLRNALEDMRLYLGGLLPSEAVEMVNKTLR